VAKANSIIFLGSNVGYQYSDSSDIDINAMGLEGETYDYWHTIFKNYNIEGHFLPGTQHPINFFFQEYTGPLDPAKWKTSLGAYDLLHDEWVKRPVPYKYLLEPQKKFAREIDYANLLHIELKTMVDGLHQAINNGDEDDIRTRVEELKAFFVEMHEKRQLAYRYGIGTPALHEYNILYKLIEHGPYHDLFKVLAD
jgi:hypothetical protein